VVTSETLGRIESGVERRRTDEWEAALLYEYMRHGWLIQDHEPYQVDGPAESLPLLAYRSCLCGGEECIGAAFFSFFVYALEPTSTTHKVRVASKVLVVVTTDATPPYTPELSYSTSAETFTRPQGIILGYSPVP
jgi:hypothetical protein